MPGIDALALAAVLGQPWADVVLSGAVTIEQLQSNVRALDIVLDRAAMGALAGSPWPTAVCDEMKPVGKPDAGNPHVRFASPRIPPATGRGAD